MDVVSMLVFCMYASGGGVTCDLTGPIYQASRCLAIRDSRNETLAKQDSEALIRRWSCNIIKRPARP